MLESLIDPVSYGPVTGSGRRQKTPPKITVIAENPGGSASSNSYRANSPYHLALPGRGEQIDPEVGVMVQDQDVGNVEHNWDSGRCNWIDMVQDAHGNGAVSLGAH